MGNLLRFTDLLNDSGGGIVIPTEGLQLWLDASNNSSYTLDGSNRITQINDLSGNDHHALSPLEGGYFGATIGLTQVNGLDVMSFDGTTQFLRADYAGLLALNSVNTTVIAVMLSNLAQLNEILVAWNTTTGGNRMLLIHQSGGAVEVTTTVQSNKRIANTGAYTAGTTVCGVYELAYTQNPRYFNNGVQSPIIATPLSNGAGSAGSFSIGQEYDATAVSNLLNGHIGELLIYDRIITDDDRVAIESYLINKWGL